MNYFKNWNVLLIIFVQYFEKIKKLTSQDIYWRKIFFF